MDTDMKQRNFIILLAFSFVEYAFNVPKQKIHTKPVKIL